MEPIRHLMYCPWTGLGLYGGFRGNRWLKNRIKIFKHFVVPSLRSQTSKNFMLWCSWRREERYNPIVQEFIRYLNNNVREFSTIHTYTGVCFWDDKYSDEVAHERLLSAIHGAMGTLVNVVSECRDVLMTIQPSDDCYVSDFVENIQKLFI